MASGDIEQPLCRVCKTVFTFKGPEPLLLPCLHATCKPCVDSEHDTITCATCRQLFHKADHTFPKHYILSNDIFKSTLKQNPSNILCTFRSDGARAETWCPKCEAFLCSTCQEFHKDIKATRGHVVESLQSYLDPEKPGARTYGYCETHQQYPLEVFDSSCGFLVCHKCLKVDHCACSVSDIDEAFDKMKESELDINIEQIVARLEVITQLEPKAQDLAKKLDANSKRVIDEVHNTFSDIRHTLETREKMISEETSQSFHEIMDRNAKGLEVLKHEKIRYEAALRFLKRSKEVTDPVEALRMKKTIDERTRVCTEADLHKIDGREASISLSTQDLSDVKQSIATFAGLYSVFDENISVNAHSGLTTREKQNKKILQLENKAEECRQTFQGIKLLTEQSHNQGIIDLKVPGIGGITEPCSFHSKIKYIRNMPWQLCSEFTLQNDVLVVGLYLNAHYGGNLLEKWTCEVNFKFVVQTSLSSFPTNMKSDITYTFTERTGFGYPNAMPMMELLNPANGFVRDGCINVSVHVTVLKTTGVPNLDELVKKKCEETLERTMQSYFNSDRDDDVDNGDGDVDESDGDSDCVGVGDGNGNVDDDGDDDGDGDGDGDGDCDGNCDIDKDM